MALKPRTQAWLLAGALCAIAPWVALAALADSSGAPNPVQTDPDDSDTPASDPPRRLAAKPGTKSEAAQLPSISVTGRAPTQSYRVYETSTATGTDTPILDIPQSIQAIPDSVLRDQAAQSLADAVRNAPGIYVQQGEGNRDEFFLRGVKTKSDFFEDGLRDDSLYYRDLYNIEQVDVLQGPAAILFGRGGAGGVINLVTKKPERRPIRNFGFELGSWEHYRGTLDVGGAVGESGAFRFMAMGEDSGGFRDHFFLHRYAANPKFSFQLGDTTKVDFGVSYLDDKRFADRGIPSKNGYPVNVPVDRFFGSVDQNRAHTRVEAFNARIAHQFSDNLAFSNAFRVTDNDRFWNNVYPGSSVDDQNQLKLKAYERILNRLTYIDRAEMVANFDTGALSHKLLSGIEYSWQRDNDRQMLPEPDSKTLPGTFPLSNPTTAPVPLPYVDFDNHAVGRELGLYVQDQLSWGEHWLALAGIRWDRFSVDAHYRAPGVTPNQTDNLDTEWSPRVGLIYKPVGNDSIYAVVTKTYTPQGFNIAVSQKSPKGANLAPEQDINYEIGNKLDLFDHRLSLTAAVFELYMKNVVAEAADGSGRLVNTGEQRNRGVELTAEGAITSKLSIFANYTYLDAEITSTTKDAVAGSRVGLVPRNAFSVWTRYALTSHWGVGAGLQGGSMKYTSYDNEVTLPGYVVADAMTYYQTDRYRVQLNVNNLTNKVYYATASDDNEIMPGTPRSLVLSLNLTF